MLNKVGILISSGLITFIVLIMGIAEPFKMCGDAWRTCMTWNYSLSLIFIPIIPFFVFALITYYMRTQIYDLWVRVALVWLATSMIIIATTPDPLTGGFGPQILFGKGDIALLTSTMMVIISISVICWKYFQRRK